MTLVYNCKYMHNEIGTCPEIWSRSIIKLAVYNFSANETVARWPRGATEAHQFWNITLGIFAKYHYQSVYFCFGVKPANSKICNQDSEKKGWKLSFFTLKLPGEAKRLKFFRNFKDGWRRRTFFKCKPPEVHFAIRNRVPYNKLL